MGSLKYYYNDNNRDKNKPNQIIRENSSDGNNLNQTIKIRIDGQDVNVGPLVDQRRIVIVINNQFTSAPNTTQIASGAGRNSAAGNNAAIDSSNTKQQQSVGAMGEASNTGMGGKQIEPHKRYEGHSEEEIVIVINNQVNSTSTERLVLLR